MTPPARLKNALGCLVLVMATTSVLAHPAVVVTAPLPQAQWTPPRAVVRGPVVVVPPLPAYGPAPFYRAWAPRYAPAPVYLKGHPPHGPRRHGWVRDDNHDGIVDGYRGPGAHRPY